MKIINGILQKSERLWQFQTKQPQKHITLQFVVNYVCGGVKRKAIFPLILPTKKARTMESVIHTLRPLEEQTENAFCGSIWLIFQTSNAGCKKSFLRAKQAPCRRSFS